MLEAATEQRLRRDCGHLSVCDSDLYIVVTRCVQNSSINPITEPNPVYSDWEASQSDTEACDKLKWQQYVKQQRLTAPYYETHSCPHKDKLIEKQVSQLTIVSTVVYCPLEDQWEIERVSDCLFLCSAIIEPLGHRKIGKSLKMRVTNMKSSGKTVILTLCTEVDRLPTRFMQAQEELPGNGDSSRIYCS
jgi:hypothetical protein